MPTAVYKEGRNRRYTGIKRSREVQQTSSSDEEKLTEGLANLQMEPKL